MIMAITLAITAMAGVRAQDTVQTGYRSFFGSESTVWNCGLEMYDVGPIDRTYVFYGDTVIEGVMYKKVVCDDLNIGLAREDTVSGKMWVKWRPQDEDELAVDLSLSVGDSFDIGFRGYYIVDSVFNDTMGRKTIHLIHDYYDDFYMKEGVGAEMLWSPFFNDQIKAFLICAYHNDTLLYTTTVDDDNIIYDSCKVRRRVGIKQTLSNKIVIWPNPFVDRFVIDVSGIESVKVYDMKGVLIVESKGKTMDMSDVPNGMYIVAVKARGKSFYKKIVKR